MKRSPTYALIIKAMIVVLLSLTLSACGGGGEGGASNGTPTGVPAPGGITVPGDDPTPPDDGAPNAQFATVVLRSVLARTLPSVVDQLRFIGRSSSGEAIFGPVLRDKNSEIVLESVPVEVTEIQIDYLSENRTIGLARVSVRLTPGGRFVISDPPFEDVQVVVDSLTVRTATPSILLGTEAQFQAMVGFTDGSLVDLADTVQWTIVPATASITGGLVHPAAPGVYEVRASLGAVTASASLEVRLSDAALLGLRVEPPLALSAPGTVREYRVFGLFDDDSELEVTAFVSAVTNNSDVTLVAATSPGQTAKIAIGRQVALGSLIDLYFELQGVSEQAELRVNKLLFTSLILGNEIRSFQVSSEGVLSPLGEVSTDPAPGGLAVHPNGIYLYLANMNSPGGITTYEIEADGTLEFVGKLSSGGCDELVIHPSGKFMYGANRNTDLFAFALNEDGTVALLDSVTAGQQSYAVAMDPLGRFVFSVGIVSDLLWTYEIGTDGKLTLVNSQTTPKTNPFDVAVSPSGDTLLVTLGEDNSVAEYSLPPSGVPNLENSIKPPVSVVSVAFDPFGRFLIGSGGNFNSFPVNPVELTSPISSEGTGGDSSWQLCLDSLGELVFASFRGSQQLRTAKVSPNGILTGHTVTTISGDPTDGATQPAAITVTP